jgi:hypothetical protein
VDIRRDINPAHLRKVLLATYEAAPQHFEQLLAVRGVGPKAVRALALVAEVVYGNPASTRDPARFSFAHGGKDGHPYPINREVYDHSVEWLRDAVGRARIGHTEKLDALKRLASYRPSSASAKRHRQHHAARANHKGQEKPPVIFPAPDVQVAQAEGDRLPPDER